jgi:heat shock protein HslJ
MIEKWLALSWLPLMLAICATGTRAQDKSQTAASDLSGPAWQLVEFRGSDGKKLAPEDKSKYTIAFNVDGRAAVRVDCNRGRSTWKSAQPHQLEFGPLALTRMACPPAPLSDRIPKDWPHVRSYTLKADRLLLALMADGGIYEIERSSSSSTSPALENTDWKLTRLSGTAVTASKQQEPYFVLNSQLRRVEGSGGCNRITGSYEANGDRLAFSHMAGTMMACLEGMDTEKAFLDALNRVNRWKITGQGLELYDASGTPIANFEARH